MRVAVFLLALGAGGLAGVRLMRPIEREAQRRLRVEIENLEGVIRLCEEELERPEVVGEARSYIEGIRDRCHRRLAYFERKLNR